MPKLQMKWSTFLSLFKAKEVLHTCGRRIGTVLKAKASRSNEVEREMSCVYFTHFFNKRLKFQSSHLHIILCYQNLEISIYTEFKCGIFTPNLD